MAHGSLHVFMLDVCARATACAMLIGWRLAVYAVRRRSRRLAVIDRVSRCIGLSWSD